jgi:hypothetical protein
LPDFGFGNGRWLHQDMQFYTYCMFTCNRRGKTALGATGSSRS